MAKRLTMAEIDTLLTVHKAGHSNREIAALLGVNRETIGKHLGRLKAQNQPNAPTGNAGFQGDFLRHGKAKESEVTGKRRLRA